MTHYNKLNIIVNIIIRRVSGEAKSFSYLQQLMPVDSREIGLAVIANA